MTIAVPASIEAAAEQLARTKAAADAAAAATGPVKRAFPSLAALGESLRGAAGTAWRGLTDPADPLARAAWGAGLGAVGGGLAGGALGLSADPDRRHPGRHALSGALSGAALGGGLAYGLPQVLHGVDPAAAAAEAGGPVGTPGPGLGAWLGQQLGLAAPPREDVVPAAVRGGVGAAGGATAASLANGLSAASRRRDALDAGLDSVLSPARGSRAGTISEDHVSDALEALQRRRVTAGPLQWRDDPAASTGYWARRARGGDAGAADVASGLRRAYDAGEAALAARPGYRAPRPGRRLAAGTLLGAGLGLAPDAIQYGRELIWPTNP